MRQDSDNGNTAIEVKSDDRNIGTSVVPMECEQTFSDNVECNSDLKKF